MNEEWRPVKGYEKYQVTSCGKVRSLDCFIVEKTGMKRFKKGRILKCFLGPSKKSKVQYYYFSVGRGINIAVHKAVTAAWLEPAPDGFDQVNHIDGNSRNNKVENLEWSNKKHNMKHAIETGLYNNFGEKHTHAKLSQSDVDVIRCFFISVNDAQIAKVFGVTHTTINSIRLKKSWKNKVVIPAVDSQGLRGTFEVR
jgi:hypothetical protein